MNALLVALAPLAPLAPKPVSEGAQHGQVRAELSYVFDEANDNFDERFAQLHVRITRGDTVLVDVDLRPLCKTCSMWPAVRSGSCTTKAAGSRT